MKTTKRLVLAISIFSLMALQTGCSSDSDEPMDNPISSTDGDPSTNSDSSEDTDLTFTEVVAKGGNFEDYPSSRTTTEISESAPKNEDYEIDDENGDPVEQRFMCVKKG